MSSLRAISIASLLTWLGSLSGFACWRVSFQLVMSARGLIDLMEPPAEAGRLASAIDVALDRPRPAPSGIDLGGAGATARQILALLDR